MFIKNYLNSIKKFKFFYIVFFLIYIGFIAYNHFSNPIEIISKSVAGIVLFLIIDMSFSLKSLYKVHLKKKKIKNVKISESELGGTPALSKVC
ncbi:MAG: hypothetical protein ACRCX8_12130 [Sarcina sp.]